jgi:hypothetical protein
LPLFFLPAQALNAEIPSSLSRIHEAVQDWRTMARIHGFVFVGEIAIMRRLPTRACRSGSEEKLEYVVRDLLWRDPDSYLRDGDLVNKGFVDCIQKPLPAPFKEGSKVIVLCSARPALGDICSLPAQATERNLNRVRQWVAELRSRQIDPVLLHVHQRLLDDGDLMRKPNHPQGAFTLNGEVLHPLVFSGKVTWIAPVPMIHTVTTPRMIDIGISRLLFGDESEPQIRVACRLNRCLDATVGAKVVGYCRVGRVGAQDCLVSIASPETATPKVNEWLLEAGLLSHSDALVDFYATTVSDNSVITTMRFLFAFSAYFERYGI